METGKNAVSRYWFFLKWLLSSISQFCFSFRQGPCVIGTSKQNNFYLNKTARLESELKEKEDIVNLNKGLSNDIKNKVIKQDEELDSLQNGRLKDVATKMISLTNEEVFKTKK